MVAVPGAAGDRVLQEIQIGTGRVDALRALADRTDVQEFRIFVGSMVQVLPALFVVIMGPAGIRIFQQFQGL